MIAVVGRELYTVAEAARILRVAGSTLQWWLEGRDGHLPVIRVEATGSMNVSWGEFVEAGFLRAYRQRGVSLQHIRPVVGLLRTRLGVPYPLAHAKPLVGPGRRLFLEAQHQAGLDEHPLVYEALSGQVILYSPLEQFVSRIDFALEGEEKTWAIRWHPAGRESPVVIDPEFAFGAPSIHGIRTEAIVEALDAGGTKDEAASDFGRPVEEIMAAASYEWAAAA